MAGPQIPDLSVIDRDRAALHGLTLAYSQVLQTARRTGAVPLARLREHLDPIVDSLQRDRDLMLWIAALELVPPPLHGRAINSALLMAISAEQLGFRSGLVRELAMAGLLLDIGKIHIPVGILARRGVLEAEEFVFIHRHVRRGYQIVRASSSGTTEVVEEAILGHHERLDGRGYPAGLRGTHVPLLGRVAAIADTYDALTHERPYAPAMSRHDALRTMAGLRRGRFDASLLRTFARAMGLFPCGTWVQLTDGRIGVVRAQTPDEPGRPHVALLTDSIGRALPDAPLLWRPRRHREIVRSLSPAEVRSMRRRLAAAIGAAAQLAA